MALEHFKLPREDWYDVVSTDEITGEKRGRIYKDRLIENFNAIEEELSELTALQPYNTKYPDTSKYIYSDTTLNSETNKVVNLKSFIDIMNLKNVPLSVEFNETMLKRLVYYDNEYKIRVLSNMTISGVGNNKPFVIADLTNQLVTASNDISVISQSLIIGKYNSTTKTIDSCYSTPVSNLDALQIQINSTRPYTKGQFQASGDGIKPVYYTDDNNNVMGLINSNNSYTISDFTSQYNREVEQ